MSDTTRTTKPSVDHGDVFGGSWWTVGNGSQVRIKGNGQQRWIEPKPTDLLEMLSAVGDTAYTRDQIAEAYERGRQDERQAVVRELVRIACNSMDAAKLITVANAYQSAAAMLERGEHERGTP